MIREVVIHEYNEAMHAAHETFGKHSFELISSKYEITQCTCGLIKASNVRGETLKTNPDFQNTLRELGIQIKKINQLKSLSNLFYDIVEIIPKPTTASFNPIFDQELFTSHKTFNKHNFKLIDNKYNISQCSCGIILAVLPSIDAAQHERSILRILKQDYGIPNVYYTLRNTDDGNHYEMLITSRTKKYDY